MRNPLFASLLGTLLIALPVSAPLAQGKWAEDGETGCSVWYIHSAMESATARWLGECVNGKAEGEGVLFYFDKKDSAKALNPKCIACDAEVWVGTMKGGYLDGKAEIIRSGYHGSYEFSPGGKKKRLERVGFRPESYERVKAVVKAALK